MLIFGEVLLMSVGLFIECKVNHILMPLEDKGLGFPHGISVLPAQKGHIVRTVCLMALEDFHF